MANRFGAYTDNPRKMIVSAIRQAESVDEDGVNCAKCGRSCNEPLRMAAELGWLAASSAADALADRRKALHEAEQVYGMHVDALVSRLELARRVLHGECFHGNAVSQETIRAVLDDVRLMVDAVSGLLARKPKRSR
jgi:hypothetical protein